MLPFVQGNMGFKSIIAASVFTLMSACSAPEYRGSVIKFGEATQAAADAQTTRLNSLTDRQISDIRGGLAEGRVILAYSSECASLAVPGSEIKDCVVVRRDGQPIAQPETFTSIVSLNKAMGEYGASLALLAADASDDAAAFSKSLTDLAASVDSLDAALDGSDAGETENAPKLQAAATGLGGVGNALFASSRVSTLREIISETDPQIQEATRLLAFASEALALSEVSASLKKIERTRSELQTAIVSGVSTQDVAKLQSRLFSEVEELKRLAATRDTYTAIGESHAELAKASQSGSSLEDLKASIFELAGLVELLSTASEEF